MLGLHSSSFPQRLWKQKSSHILKAHFGVQTLDGFGFEHRPLALQASALLLAHLQQQQMHEDQVLSSYWYHSAGCCQGDMYTLPTMTGNLP